MLSGGWLLVAGAAVYFVAGYVIALRNPEVAGADAASAEGLRAIAANTRDWSLTVGSQIVAILLTVGGFGALAKGVDPRMRTAPTISAGVFAAGAALMLLYLGFHLFITPHPPNDYEMQRRRFASLYRVYLVAAYTAFAYLGSGIVVDHLLGASWIGWFLIVTGAVGLATAVVRRPAVANLPLWVHAIAGVLGAAIVLR